MNRSMCAMMTAAAVAGCQGTAKTTAKPVAVVPGTAGKPVAAKVAKPVGQPLAAATPAAGGNVTQVGYNSGQGYNTGNGVMSNNRFGRQKIAAAVPSHGGMPPGMGGPGMEGMGMPPGMGGPGMGGPGMGGPGMGGMGMPPGMGGPGMGPMGPGGYAGQPLGPRFTTSRTQIRFASPLNMKVVWQTSDDGINVRFGDTPLMVPDRYNFAQGQIFRLKLYDIQKREGAELYPTLEVYPGSAKTDAYLAHNAVPLEFTDEDFEQVAGGNMVTKVIYLPDAKYQELAIAGVETLVSTRLDPGVDPVKEAHRRGSILAVVRMGSVDLEPAHSPPLLPTGPAGMGPQGMGMQQGRPQMAKPPASMPMGGAQPRPATSNIMPPATRTPARPATSSIAPAPLQEVSAPGLPIIADPLIGR